MRDGNLPVFSLDGAEASFSLPMRDGNYLSEPVASKIFSFSLPMRDGNGTIACT